jgi:2-iminobutanoate/2-iminopropanoate deaminase
VQPTGLRDAAPSGYSHGVLVGQTLYVSGQISGADGIEAQMAEALDRIRQVVETAGGTMADVVKLTVFTTVDDCWPRTERARQAALPRPWPAVTMVLVRGLALPQLLVEVEAVAVLGSAAQPQEGTTTG